MCLLRPFRLNISQKNPSFYGFPKIDEIKYEVHVHCKYTLVEKSLQVTVYHKAFFEEKLLCLGTKGCKGQYL